MPDILVRSFAPFLLAFQPCFTQPSFSSFWALACAWILCSGRQFCSVPRAQARPHWREQSPANWAGITSSFIRAGWVSDGLAGVQKVADRIFGHLMQLDHAVVLFDEVDELVHPRDDGGSDHLSRFLTTSMLPRLAEL